MHSDTVEYVCGECGNETIDDAGRIHGNACSQCGADEWERKYGGGR